MRVKRTRYIAKLQLLPSKVCPTPAHPFQSQNLRSHPFHLSIRQLSRSLTTSCPVSVPVLSFLSVAVGALPRPDRAPAGTPVIPPHSANLPTGRPTRTPPHRSTRSRYGTFARSPRAWARGGLPPPPPPASPAPSSVRARAHSPPLRRRGAASCFPARAARPPSAPAPSPALPASGVPSHSKRGKRVKGKKGKGALPHFPLSRFPLSPRHRIWLCSVRFRTPPP